MITEQSTAVAQAYIEAVGRHDLEPLRDLIADHAVATFAGDALSKAAWLVALAQLLPVLVRNDIRHLSGNGDVACVVYDFVTDTPAGAVPCVELIRVEGGKITSIELILDRVTFEPVNEALRALASPEPAAEPLG